MELKGSIYISRHGAESDHLQNHVAPVGRGTLRDAGEASALNASSCLQKIGS